MPDPRTTKLADILVNYSTKVQPGEWVRILTEIPAMPLVNELYKLILQAGGFPSVSFTSNQLEETYLANANNEQLKWLSPDTKFVIENIDVLMTIRAPENTRTLSGINPKRQQMQHLSRKDWLETYWERSVSGDLRWVVTNYPCLSYA
jgi:aminopeptidase